jgi:pyridoxine kinase
MARILAISSQVARGAVGLSISVPAMQRLGHEVVSLPTVRLSNHPGYPHVCKIDLSSQALSETLRTLDANGWLAGIDGVLTGYLPSVAHVSVAMEGIDRVRAHSPAALVVCDPILGDDPKGLYIDAAAAAAIRDRLLPAADLATPNRFELSCLTGRPVRNPDEAVRALDCLACGGGLATSIPCHEPGKLMNLISFDAALAGTTVDHLPDAPHGTGDLMAGILTGALLAGIRPDAALATATAVTAAMLAAARGRDSLDVSALSAGPLATGWPVETFGRPESRRSR